MLSTRLERLEVKESHGALHVCRGHNHAQGIAIMPCALEPASGGGQLLHTINNHTSRHACILYLSPPMHTQNLPTPHAPSLTLDQ